jgi:hypothetical protein
MQKKDEEMDRPAYNCGKRTKKCGAPTKDMIITLKTAYTRIREKAPQVSPLNAKKVPHIDAMYSLISGNWIVLPKIR